MHIYIIYILYTNTNKHTHAICYIKRATNNLNNDFRLQNLVMPRKMLEA